MLQAQGKLELLDALRGILPSWATCVYIRQPAPLGLGHAVLCARPVVGDAPFMVHLADDLIDAPVPCLKQMVDVFHAHGGSVLGVQNVPSHDTDKYGIVSLERKMSARVGKMSHIVGFDKRLGQSRAIHLDERLGTPRAAPVQQIGRAHV